MLESHGGVLFGIFLVITGLVFLRWPTIFRRGLWLKTSVAIRTMSDDGYASYMKRLGILYVIGGIGVIGWILLHRL